MQDATRPVERTKLEISSLVETVMDEAAEASGDGGGTVQAGGGRQRSDRPETPGRPGLRRPRQAGAERVAAAEALRNRQETSHLTAERVENGLDTRAELKQAEAATPASQADVEALDEQILLTRHRIAALLGEGPDRGLDITMPKTEAVKAFGLPADLRLHLIGRRPDIVAARLRAEAAAHRVASAKAQFYPDITLNAYVGQQSLGLSQLFNPAAAIVVRGGAALLCRSSRAGAYAVSTAARRPTTPPLSTPTTPP